MGKKRKCTAETQRSPKRSRSLVLTDSATSTSSPSGRPAKDHTYGQASAIPVDGDNCEHEEAGGVSTREAMEYLRTVRSEADGIPHLLVAPPEPAADGVGDPAIYNSGRGDSRGIYRSGVYIAAPMLGPRLPSPSVTSLNPESNDSGDGGGMLCFKPQQAFTRRLLSLFKKQRKLLATDPPIEDFKRLPKNMKLTFPRGFQAGYAAYRALTYSHNPIPVYLAALSQKTLLRMLEFATEDLKRNRNVDPRQTAWFWGLLCRLGDVGTMDSEAVSVVRELGKKAVWVGLGFFDQEAARLTAEYGEPDDVPRNGIITDNLNEERDGRELGCEPRTDGGEEPQIDSGSEAMDISSSQGSGREQSPAGSDASDLESEFKQRSRNTSSAPSDMDDDDSAAQDATPLGASAAGADLESARSRLLDQIGAAAPEPVADIHTKKLDPEELHPGCPDRNTCATLDMIIVIAGEVYGQRDLLEIREIWGGEHGLWG